MIYINLYKNYFVKYEDFFKIIKVNNGKRKIQFNNNKYFISEFEIENLKNNYSIINIKFIHRKNMIKILNEQYFTILENTDKKSVFLAEDKKTNEKIFRYEGRIINDNLDIENLNFILSLTIKK